MTWHTVSCIKTEWKKSNLVSCSADIIL
uniref:Uncharacterized protein n=1 Tax=Anguilla anguilla TaxID=7936 RepID=A0A0E9V8C4_ANGAN